MIIAEDMKKGRVFIMAPERGLPASVIKRDGKWTAGDFTADDLNENFTVVTSAERIEELIREAKAAFSSRFIRSTAVSPTP